MPKAPQHHHAKLCHCPFIHPVHTQSRTPQWTRSTPRTQRTMGVRWANSLLAVLGGQCVLGEGIKAIDHRCVHELGGQHIITTRVIDRKRRRASGQGHLESWWHDSIWMGPALRCHTRSVIIIIIPITTTPLSNVLALMWRDVVWGWTTYNRQEMFSLSSLLVVRLLMIIVERIHIQHHPI